MQQLMVDEWDPVEGRQITRPATPEEIAEIVQKGEGLFQSQKEAYLTDIRAMRERLLNRLAGITMGIIAGEPPEESSIRDLYRTLRQSLLDMTTIPSIANATTMPQLKAAAKAEYARLVGLASATSLDFVRAFREVDE